MDKGWIKLHRKLIDSSIFGHEGLLKLWILCLLKASHKEREVMLSGVTKPIKLKPGQFVTGRDSLHSEYHQGFREKYRPETRPVAKSLYRWLENLEEMQNLSIKKTNKYSIVTITNWGDYQGIVQQMSNSCPSSVHKQECNKNEKNILPGEKASRSKPNPDVKRFMDWWCETFKGKFGTKYHVTGSKEGAIIKRLLSTDSYEELLKLAERFFDSDDTFIKQAGYTIGVFSTQINKLKSQKDEVRYAT